MACDLTTLATVDTNDIDELMQVIDQCRNAALDPHLWFWAIAFTIVGGVVGAWVGKRKNAVVRDAILGAALGPIGWLVSLCLPVPKPAPRCPACKREVGSGDAHCRHCGAKLKSS
jgi:hypothetical protein